ncbi:MAG: transglycosylase SLT domain-containing protein [Candidatus Acidiferrales bacterium]
MLLACFSASTAFPQTARRQTRKERIAAARAAAAERAAKRAAAAQARRFAVEAKQLTTLSRALKNEKNPGAAYRRLAAFAKRYSKEELGARAALALGYYDFNQGRYAEARRWLDAAKPETLLADYVLFWSAQVDRNLGNLPAALGQLETLRRDYPQSAMSALALQAFAEAAIAANQPQRVLTAFAAQQDIDKNPKFLFLRAQAYEQSGDKIAAAGDYLSVYDHFPLSTSAAEAGEKVNYFQGVLGDAFPKPNVAERLARAGILFDAHHWQDAQTAYSQLLSELVGSDQELAQLRIADCGLQLGGISTALASLQLQTPEVDAERLYYLSQAYRSANDEPNMLASISQAIARAPQSPWTERALFATGNYYWVLLDRDKAANYYQQVADRFPQSADAIDAQWRVLWASYMGHRDDAASLLTKFLTNYPNSVYTPDALYWLGRLAQDAGQAADARAYYQKLQQRYPNNYFTVHAAAHLRALKRGAAAPLPLLDAISPLAPSLQVGAAEAPEALPWVQRSVALETIAFDDSAMLELRAAYDITHSPMLQLAIARASANGEHYGGSIVALRIIYPELESRRFADVPREVWMLSFPLPYAQPIRRAARRERLDPMLVTALIRQESAFEKNALSVSNAFGLMQLLPKTAAPLSHRIRMRYSEARLFDPLYNLRLGTLYFSGLLKTFHSAEAALAAYNAGEDRVTLWQTGQHYAELPEFVESIPFTQTRQYVEIIMRNAVIYRQLYGGRR